VHGAGRRLGLCCSWRWQGCCCSLCWGRHQLGLDAGGGLVAGGACGRAAFSQRERGGGRFEADAAQLVAGAGPRCGVAAARAARRRRPLRLLQLLLRPLVLRLNVRLLDRWRGRRIPGVCAASTTFNSPP
jgi:hypothetical protein